MAEGTDSPVLKRKREGAEPLRKKIRRQSDAGALQNGEDAQVQDVATPKPAKSAKNPVVNGTHKTPSSSRADKKTRNKGAGKDTPQGAAPIATPAISRVMELANGTAGAEGTPSSTRKQKKKNKGTPKNTPNEASKTLETQQTPSKTVPQSEQALDKTKDQNMELVNQGTSVKTKEKKDKKKPRSRWTWSSPVGGWFLPEDPVFTSDEKCLLLANARKLFVYATDTSTLVSSLSKSSSRISTYALSATNPRHVYTASDSLITLWDWTNGKTLGRWDIGSPVQSMSVVADPVSNMDLVYSHESPSSHIINVHALRTREQLGQTELKQILKKKLAIKGMRVLFDGKIVIVVMQKAILIGKRKAQKTALQEYEYVWREFQTSKTIMTFDAYVRIPEQSSTGKQPSDSGGHVDLAVGDQEGAIWLFEDVLSAYIRIEKTRKDGARSVDLEMLRPKKLHWHRDAVGSVKWSRDGNYLISGGKETVLVLWQLSTGKQQHLPHLTAAIENIVVSPSGASYAVSLANNSVIVLSTTELEAKMNIIGVQSRKVEKELFPRTATPNDYATDLFNSVPMVVDPGNPSQMLFSVPSSQPRQDMKFRSEPYLQTFDLATQHAVSKQALTRNNATDPNMAPDGRPIEEPTVKLMQISSDEASKWLATVDEWIPPKDDLSYLDEGIQQFNQEERQFRREVYLKFWEWDEKNDQWILNSRLDAPHFYETIGAGARILDLAADPSGTGFATVGEDRTIRIWKPKTRTRGGVIVHGADKGEGLITWSLYRAVDLGCSLDVLETGQADAISHVPHTSKLAFSEDGSVLAAGVADAESGVIHIVDTVTGTIRRSITELDVTKLSSLGILGRHLIVVSGSIVVWDLVTDELVYCISDGAWNTDRFGPRPTARLAINSAGGTFAVALPYFEENSTSKARESQRLLRAFTTVGVFSPFQPKAISESKCSNYILSLVPERNGRGYIALDNRAAFTTFTPAAVLQLPTPLPEKLPQPIRAGRLKADSDAEDEDESDRLAQDLATLTEDGLLFSENDKPVVRPEQLQQVFDAGPAHALPPVKDLFNAVVGLFARKPRVVGAA